MLRIVRRVLHRTKRWRGIPRVFLKFQKKNNNYKNTDDDNNNADRRFYFFVDFRVALAQRRKNARSIVLENPLPVYRALRRIDPFDRNDLSGDFFFRRKILKFNE